MVIRPVKKNKLLYRREESEHEICRKQKQNLPFYLNKWSSFAFVGHSFPCGNNHPSISYEKINLSEDVCHVLRRKTVHLKNAIYWGFAWKMSDPPLLTLGLWSWEFCVFKGSLVSLFKEILVQRGCHWLCSMLLCSQMKPYLKKDDSLSSHRCTGMPVRIKLLT